MEGDMMFACEGCGKQYRWKPETAGKKARCKCGQVIAVPKDPPGAPAEEDLYDLADDDKPAAPRPAPVAATSSAAVAGAATMAPSAVAASPAALPAGVIPYGGIRSPASGREDLANAVGGSEWRELYLPGSLVLLGLAMQVFQNMYDGGSWRSFTHAIPFIGLGMGFNLVLSFLGILLVARLLEVSFGAPGPAILKLAAICLLPPAIAASAGDAVGYDSFFVRMMVSALLMFPLVYLAFWMLFDLDFEDAAYCVVIVWIVNDWIVIFLVGLLLSSSASVPAGMLGGGRSGAPTTDDQWATQTLRGKQAVDLETWFEQRHSHLIGPLTRRESQRLLADLKGTGVTEIKALPEYEETYTLIITLPRDREARQRVFDWQDRAASLLYDTAEDEGQKYLVARFRSRIFLDFD